MENSTKKIFISSKAPVRHKPLPEKRDRILPAWNSGLTDSGFKTTLRI